MISAEDKKRLDYLDRVLAPIISRMSRSSVPLCNVKGDQLPTAGGSGVLLHVGKRRYLITAAHVVDAAIEGRVFAAIMGANFVEVGSRKRWRTKRRDGATEDRTDLAIIDLDGLPEGVVAAVTFLDLEDLAPYYETDEREISTAFLAIGYPRSKQPKSLDGIHYRALSYSFVSHREALPEKVSVGADPLLHIAIGYDKLGFEGIEPTSQMPKPEGCSGGGLWMIPKAMTSDAPMPKLVGIMIENIPRPYDVILASRIWNIVGGLRAVSSENREAIDVVFPYLEERAIEFLEAYN
jgi:hypothetical protein